MASHDPRPLSWVVHSADRTGGSSSTDFTLDVDEPLRLESGGWFRIAAVSFPMSYYAIRTGVNDLIVNSLGNATIPAGTYSPAALAAAAQTVLVAVDANFTVTYSPTTMAFTIANTSTFTLWSTATNTAAIAMGFPDALRTTATSHTSTQAPTLGEPLAFYLESAKITSGGPAGFRSGARGSKLVQRIPNAAASGDILHWSANRSSGDMLPFNAPAGGMQLSRLDFALRAYDDRGDSYIVDLRGGALEVELEVGGLE